MKTQKSSRTLGVIKNVFNVRKWSDFDRMRAFTSYLGTGIKKMVVPRKEPVADTKNTFASTVSAMNLSEKDLASRCKGLYRLSVLMCTVAFCIFAYAVYHMVYGSIKAVIVSLVVSLIALTLAFRYHYWYFQIKERKLGCTFKEWYRQGLLGEKE
jgi:intracellular multiplication protein IcmV